MQRTRARIARWGGLLLSATLLGAPVFGAAAAAPQPASGEATLRHDLQAFWPQAAEAGVSRGLFDAAIAGLTPDPSVVALTRRQPEFAKSIGAYLSAQITPARVAAGRERLARWGDTLDAIEHRFGVPRAVLVAVWGLETNYGTAAGSKDVLRSIATLAALHYREPLYRDEFVAALTLLQAGAVRREALRGSWAGAMGQPQFMPSSFAAYAVDGDGDGRRDIWTSVPDSLASIANFLRAKGWTPGAPWGFEVKLPTGFDLAQSRAPFAAWRARGVIRANGTAMPSDGEGILLFPAGVAGPALLVTANFELIKSYNFSDAYVIAVGQLADRMEGGAAIAAAWPDSISLSRPDRIALQAQLASLGFAVDNTEGRISLALRDTIRQAQARVHLVTDGYPTEALLSALRKLPH